MFLSFISCLKCYPAERLHLFKLTWGKSSSVQFALYYQCYCLNPVSKKKKNEFHSEIQASQHDWDLWTASRQTWREKSGMSNGNPLLTVSQNKTSHHSVAQHASCHFATLIKLTVWRLRATWVKLFITRQETIITCLIFTTVQISHCCLIYCTYGLFCFNVTSNVNLYCFLQGFILLHCFVIYI